MATTGVLNGTNLRLFLNTGTGQAYPVAYATSCTIDMNAEELDTLTKDSVGSFRNFQPGQLSATVSGEGLISFDTSGISGTRREFADLFTAFKNKTRLYGFYSTDATGDDKYEFYGYITALSSSGAVEGNATYSYTIGVDGEITKVTVT